MRLNDSQIRAARATDRPVKLHDGGGLFLLVTPKGSRWWRFKYRIGGREKSLSLGVYPDVSLKIARDRRDAARRLVAAGSDPSLERQREKAADGDTLQFIYNEWAAKQEAKLATITMAKVRWLFSFILPRLGKRPIAKIMAADVLAVLREIEKRGHIETAHRAKMKLGQLFRYAVATGRAPRDPTVDLRGALSPIIVKNRAAITRPTEVGHLLVALDQYQGQPATLAALRLAPLLFVRPGELRAAEWREVDLDRAEWRISAERTKMREMHIVPLSWQALAILRDLEALTGGGRYVFPSLLGGHRPMSENTVNVALRRLGYGADEMCGHGFRALASTLLNEQGFPPDVIERQLAHKERNKVRAAYDRSERLADRKAMMQSWADYLDSLRAAVTVVRKAA